jgi:hypothetical protein
MIAASNAIREHDIEGAISMGGDGSYDFEEEYKKLYRRYSRLDVPPCPRCGSKSTATVQVGIVGLTIRLAATCSTFKLIPNGPRPGEWFCNSCSTYFDVPSESGKEGAA